MEKGRNFEIIKPTFPFPQKQNSTLVFLMFQASITWVSTFFFYVVMKKWRHFEIIKLTSPLPKKEKLSTLVFWCFKHRLSLGSSEVYFMLKWKREDILRSWNSHSLPPPPPPPQTKKTKPPKHTYSHKYY